MDKKTVVKKALLAGLIAFLGGCATMAIEPPGGAVKAEMGFPPPGTEWRMKIVDHEGAVETRAFAVLEESVYQGKQVYRTTDGDDIGIFDKATGNLIAALQGKDLKELFVYSPHEETFSWPLWVGKQWRASPTAYDRVKGRSWSPIEDFWKVEAYEDVTVPAGTYKAFRLRSTPGKNSRANHTIWYAPEIKLIVKEVAERTWGHYRGPGKFVSELIEYLAP